MSREERRCPLTGASSFVDALAAILGSSDLGKQLSSVEVSRTQNRARILFGSDTGEAKVSVFVPKSRPLTLGFQPGLYTQAMLTPSAVQVISEVLLGSERVAQARMREWRDSGADATRERYKR